MWGLETTGVPKAKPEAPATPCPAPWRLPASDLTRELPLLWAPPARAGGGPRPVQSILLCLPRPRPSELGLWRAR